jgi:DNA-binding NarL/FixJ family response regulator
MRRFPHIKGIHPTTILVNIHFKDGKIVYNALVSRLSIEIFLVSSGKYFKIFIFFMMNSPTNILIVSPQCMFRKGIEIVLATEPDIQIIDSVDFSNGVEYSVENLPPDIAILDIDGPENAGFDIAHRLKQRLPNIAIIIFSAYPNDEQLFQTLKAQAAAYISKEATTDEIIHIVKRVAGGEYPINESLHTRPKVAEQVLMKFQELSSQSKAEELVSPLTRRETEILEHIANGFLNKQIAASLEISEQTIKNHVTSILRKLNANARTEAVVIAIKRGIISVD